jgi:o-succinylbenzoate---CoA ligase
MIDFNLNINWLEQQSNLNPDLLAIISDNVNLTFEQLQNIVFKVSGGFASKGVKKDDLVGLLFSNSIEFVYSIHALWQIGAIPVPLNIKLNSLELEKQIEFASINFLIIEDNLFPNFTGLKNNPVKFSKLLENNANITLPNEKFSLENTALILFTSGSTSDPKAVELTFNILYFSADSIKDELKFSHADSFLASLPFYHIGGFSIITRALLNGSKLVLAESLSTDAIYSAMQKYKPTIISLVPTTLKRFLDLNFSPTENLRCIFLGGGPIKSSILKIALSAGWKLFIVYGSTETCSMVTILKTDEIVNRFNCAGKPIGDNRIFIKDANGKILSAGAVGNVVVKSKSVMKGFLRNESAKISNREYNTDDLGFLDEDGYLYITGRKDDVIISGGENINCREVDKVLLTHPNITDCYCFGLEDKEWGQVLCAAIVVTNKNNISENSLRDYMKKKLASFKIPKKYFWVSRIPKNDLGKVNKSKLLELIN